MYVVCTASIVVEDQAQSGGVFVPLSSRGPEALIRSGLARSTWAFALARPPDGPLRSDLVRPLASAAAKQSCHALQESIFGLSLRYPPAWEHRVAGQPCTGLAAAFMSVT